LWLLANNKTLTRDNLAKRKEIYDLSCLLYNEKEFVTHLFFNCCVARELWNEFADILGVPVIVDFESMAKNWLGGNRLTILNVYVGSVDLMEDKEWSLISGGGARGAWEI
jgi:hypothetical protein